MIEKVAPTMATTLILGESGTGKELIARALHDLGSRRDRPFVAINCAAIPESLLESELFGYERGAFTGALKQTPGKLELAHGGTLFLDEVGDMPLPLQVKLLRFLEERVIERVGGREHIAVDVRVVCATNQDLQALLEAKTFRQDLYYRISEVTVRIPPLRERPGDAAVIAKVLLERYVTEHRSPVRGFSPDALRAIQNYPWPGNVRELENRISAAVIMAEGKFVGAHDLGLPMPDRSVDWLNLRVARQRAEREVITQALAVANGNVSRAAELLGITRPTLYDLLERNDITVAERAPE
jgi:two-component system NtrC family response regulator